MNNLIEKKHSFFIFIFFLIFTFYSFSFFSCKEDKIKNPSNEIKIVSLGSGDCEILAALNLIDNIVGVGEYCNYPPQLLDKPVLVSNFNVNREMLFFLQADIIFADKMTQNQNTVNRLIQDGFNVVYTGADTIDELYLKIKTISSSLNKIEEGEELILSIKNKIEKIRNDVNEKNENQIKKKVYFEISPLEYGLWTCGKETFIDEICEILQVENIFSQDLSGWVQVSQEEIIKKNPDYIFTLSNIIGDTQLTIDEIKSRPAWENISAVRNNEIYYIDSDIISRPGPRLTDAIQALYQCLYGN